MAQTPESTSETAKETGSSRESQDLLIAADSQEKIEAEDVDVNQQLTPGETYKTQSGEGHTFDPIEADRQGLVYTPPTDPPVVPGDDPQGAEVATGFGMSLEDNAPEAQKVPPRVANNDLDLRDNVYIALQLNSETGHLDNVKIQVDEGVVNLLGTVQSEDDIGRVHSVVNELEGVQAIRNNLQVQPA